MTYDYFCKNCQNEFEIEQSIKDDPLTHCPSCNEDNCLKRLITGGSGFVLRGGGWAADNYSKKSS